MDPPEAGPSRTPGPTIQLDNGSSDDIEEVPLSKTRTTKGKSRAKPKANPAAVAEDVSPAQPVARSRRIPRTATTRAAARSTTVARSTANLNSKGKGKQVDKDETILVQESTDEDEPMFVGESIAKKLASKFTFQSTTTSKSNSSLSSSSSSSVVVVGVKDRPIVVEDEKPQPPPLPLLAPLDPVKAPPVPAWLGRTAVLLQIPYCVVCRVRWKRENGAARWVSLPPGVIVILMLTEFQRHTSTCLPPLYRPPNPPPNLPQMVHEALIETSGASTPSLLELHLNATPEAVDNRVDRKQKGPAKLKGLAKMINVKPTEERGGVWEGEVDERVTSMLGRPRTPEIMSPSVKSSALSPFSSPGTVYPATQPLGNSALANHYARDQPGSHALSDELKDEDDYGKDDEELEIPMPPSSQKRYIDDQENEDPNTNDDIYGEPFRSRGGLRVDGGLPYKRSTGFQEWEFKRIRTDELRASY